MAWQRRDKWPHERVLRGHNRDIQRTNLCWITLGSGYGFFSTSEWSGLTLYCVRVSRLGGEKKGLLYEKRSAWTSKGLRTHGGHGGMFENTVAAD